MNREELMEIMYNEQNFDEWTDKDTGYICRMIRPYDGGHLCGYVKLPDNYPLKKEWNDDYDKIPVEVHGGVTFYRPMNEDIKDERWVGFDCVHSGDLNPRNILVYNRRIYPDEVYRTKQYVKDECKSLARQLKDMEGC